ncbi:MAG: sodium/proton antiporter NhaB [Cellvibrionales bacterium]|nr:sodium/proton antiporter NhaB [Cellvibrionales bacterium]
MKDTLFHSLHRNFLGDTDPWYKHTIAAFLVLNPILYFTAGPFIAGWVLLGQFIFTLAMALKCYPLQAGGLLALEALAIGMASPDSLLHEVEANLEVLLLLIFMVAGIHFMRDLLLHIFTRILLGVRSKLLLSLLFCASSALLSAFLDALTVTAVLIAVASGFYTIYQRVAYGTDERAEYALDEADPHREEMENYRAFLRSLIMHGAIGTALGGVLTMVGEPQNLLIAGITGWDFGSFFHAMAPVTLPALLAGLLTCAILEASGRCGYGAKLSPAVRTALENFQREQDAARTSRDSAALLIQALVGLFVVVALATHMAPVGLIGLAVIVLLTACNGVTEEHRIGHAFADALPFTALLVVFFAIVSVIQTHQLFDPITALILAQPMERQPLTLFFANGLLSMISDNVFVATVYIKEAENAFLSGQISRSHFEQLAIAVNTGTNLPSVATPNGQAAFLFLLTSALAPRIHLSYMRMLLMALPYTLVLTAVAAIAIALVF